MRKLALHLTRGLLLAFSAIPLRFHYVWAGFFALVLKDVTHYRKDVVMVNLARSFPDKKYKELRQISNRFYKHFGEIIAEAIWFGGCLDPDRLHKQKLIEIENPEVLYDAFSSSPSVMVLDSHCGNWEILGGYFEYDYKVQPADRSCGVHDAVVVYKPLTNKFWDELVGLNRCAPIIRRGYKGYTSSKAVLRYAISHKSEKKIYIFPTDQYPYAASKASEQVDFMRQPTQTMHGAAALAGKLGMSVLYLNMKPLSRGHYQIKLTPVCEDASKVEPHEIMQRYYSLLQKDLDDLPWNYLWTHKRWK